MLEIMLYAGSDLYSDPQLQQASNEQHTFA